MTAPPAASERPVYIVDDDAEVRRSTWFLLTTAGYAPRVFTNGLDFLGEQEFLKPGPVMLDLRMPDLDGFQLLEAMRASAAPLPTIVMTGHGDVATAVRAMKLGARDFIEKPFDDVTVISAVDQAIGSLQPAGDRQQQDAAAHQRISALSRRERDVLSCLAAGLSNKVMAHQLGLSTRTVEMHRAKMMERLGVRSLPEALRLAFKAGLL